MKSKGDLISVIIPVYNVEKYLNKCVESVMRQTYRKLEIILVDDGSTDLSGSMCDKIKEKDKRIKVIHKKNGGLSDARNVGIENASGKYLSFIDSDDYVNNNYISSLYEVLVDYNADMSIGSHRVIYEKNCINKSNGRIFIADSETILKKMLYDDGIDLSAWGKLYSAQLFRNIRFPKGRLFEDSATTYKLIDKSKKIVVYSKPLYNYVIRKNSISTEEFSERKMDLIVSTKEMANYIKDKYPKLASACDRRVMYSYLSTLTQLAKSNKANSRIQSELMKYIKEHRMDILKDKNVPKRDKVALYTTFFGFSSFKMLWNLYSKITGRS